MSDRDDEEPRGGDPPTVAWVRERYEGIILVGLAVFMLWVRMQSYDRFVRGDKVLFSGNDPYYHLREVQYTVRHWPATMPFDPWTHYPFGTSVDQFGTLYDQLVATVALVIGLGDPSPTLVAQTLAVSPAVIGALIVFPAYYAGRRLGGSYGGLFGALVLALLPGSILTRTLVGSADHQAIEALAMITAVLGVMVALGVAKEEKPVYELVLDRDYEALRRPVGWSAVAGVLIGLYVWVWPPAILLIGVLGVFFAIKMSADYYHGRTPEPVAFVAVVSMSVAGIVVLLPTTELSFSPTNWSLIQPLSAFAIAAGAVGLSWLAREWDDREYERALYPLTVGGAALVATAVTRFAVPSVYNTFASNFLRFVGFSAGAATRTIREAQPYLRQARTNPQVFSPQEVIMIDYGLMFFTAMLALGLMLARPLFYSRDRADHATLVGGLLTIAAVWEFDVGSALVGVLPVDPATVVVETAIVAVVLLVAMVRGDHDGEELFVAVWMLFMTAAAFTQVRFNYYLALAVVVLNAYLIREFLEYVAILRPDGSVVEEVEPYQMMAVMLALLVVLPVLVMPLPYFEQEIGQGQTRTFTSDTAVTIGNNSGPGAFTQWEGALEWVNESTPREGTYGGAGNEMEYYGTFEQTDDFEYQDGTYGVMSWWDYGHWITIEGERIPNANPFQEGATNAANYLLAPNESQANEVLERDMGETEETRYVMIDHQMANPYGKFSAPTVFYDDANVSYRGDFVSGFHFNLQTGRAAYRLNTQRYYESMMIRLFRFHGSRVEPQPVVVDWDVRNGTRVIPEEGGFQDYRQLGPQGMRAAEQALANDTTGPPNTSTIGGIGHFVREPVPAVEHYRLVRASEDTTVSGRGERPAYLRPVSQVKVFERVPGATVEGQGPPNTTILASVDMRLGSRDENFTYTQQVRTDEDGNFEMTLPYSTTGYGEFGPEEGYTNVSVRAEGPYRFSTNLVVENGTPYVYSDRAHVPEGTVVGENDSTITVDLEREQVNLTSGGGEGSENSSALRSVEASPTGADAASGEPAPSVDGPGSDGSAPVAPSAVAPETAVVGSDAGAPSAGDPSAGAPSAGDPSAGAPSAGDPSAGGAAPSRIPGGLPGALFVALLAGLAALEVRDGRR